MLRLILLLMAVPAGMVDVLGQLERPRMLRPVGMEGLHDELSSETENEVDGGEGVDDLGGLRLVSDGPALDDIAEVDDAMAIDSMPDDHGGDSVDVHGHGILGDQPAAWLASINSLTSRFLFRPVLSCLGYVQPASFIVCDDTNHDGELEALMLAPPIQDSGIHVDSTEVIGEEEQEVHAAPRELVLAVRDDEQSVVAVRVEDSD